MSGWTERAILYRDTQKAKFTGFLRFQALPLKLTHFNLFLLLSSINSQLIYDSNKNRHDWVYISASSQEEHNDSGPSLDSRTRTKRRRTYFAKYRLWPQLVTPHRKNHNCRTNDTDRWPLILSENLREQQQAWNIWSLTRLRFFYCEKGVPLYIGTPAQMLVYQSSSAGE